MVARKSSTASAFWHQRQVPGHGLRLWVFRRRTKGCVRQILRESNSPNYNPQGDLPYYSKVLHRVFSPYGSVKQIIPFSRQSCVQFLVQYQGYGAVGAKSFLQGRNIYDGCCQLDIQLYDDVEWTNIAEPTQVLEFSVDVMEVGSGEMLLQDEVQDTDNKDETVIIERDSKAPMTTFKGFDDVIDSAPASMKDKYMEFDSSLHEANDVIRTLPPLSVAEPSTVIAADFTEVDRFRDLEQQLKSKGYSGIWKMRTGKAIDGCAIFWRTSRIPRVQVTLLGHS